MFWRCELCEDNIVNGRILDHLRLIHPDIDMDLETWPDGLPVFYDWS